MKRINITVTPLSYLLNSAGKGSGLRDTEIRFNKKGFPLIHKKTFKGLLRESVQEVLEIEGADRESIQNKIADFFGKEGGNNQGRLTFEHDLQIQNWSEISEELSKRAIPVSDIKEYFTHEISQTKIADDGVAEDYSLRTIGVLRPEVVLESSITIEDFKEGEEALLQKSFWNLRSMGMQRNRGLGKVSVAMKIEKFGEEKPSGDEGSNLAKGENLKVKIFTESPMLLTQSNSNVNTVYTESVIAGNKLRGIFASIYIRQKMKSDQNYNANDDDDFYAIFLSGKVVFGFARFGETMHLPMHWQSTKSNKNKLHNVFEYSGEENISYKAATVESVEGAYKTVSPSKTLNFHNSRTNRRAGRSLEEEGSIYYYETIDEGQCFEAIIQSKETALLNKLHEISGNDFQANIGKNKSTLGKVRISLSASESPTKIKGKKFQLLVKSPLVLLNENGFPQISEALLQSEIEKIHPQLKLDSEKIAFGHCEIDHYVTLWQAKIGAKLAIAAGSSCVLESDIEIGLPTKLFLGMYNEQGYGEVVIEPYDERLKESSLLSKETKEKRLEPDHEFQNQLLKNISRQLIQKEKDIVIKTKAIQCAKDYNRQVSNSFLTKLIDRFESYNSYNEINEFVQENAGKRFGESLKKAGLAIVNGKTVRFKFNYRNEYKAETFEEHKVFWIEFLKTVRLTNKAEK